MSDKTVSGAELVVETLNAHNVPHIFGIPGAKVDAVFDAVFVFEGFLGFIVTDLKQQLGEFR